MANTLRIKRRASGGAAGAPTTSQCVNAELAFNEVDGILYYGKGGDGTASSSVVAIGAELGTGVAAFLKTPSSANLATALTDETGSSTVVFSNSPTLVTPNIGTPSAGTLTNCTGLPVSTGVSGLGAGVATFLATPSSANLAAALSDETGTNTVVFSNNPSLTLPLFSTASTATGGSTQGTNAITTDVLHVRSGATTVTLPAVANGKRVTVINKTSSAITVYPATGESIDFNMANGTWSLGANSSMTFFGVTNTLTSATAWVPQYVDIGSSVSGLGTGVATFLATPNSANLYAALTDETGSATGSPLVMFNVNPTVTSSLKVSLGNILYSKLLYNGAAVYNYSDDTVAGSFTYASTGQYAPTSGWLTKGNIVFSDSYGATTPTALKWQVASGSLGETAVWSTLSCAAVPATYAAHPAGESGYGKLAYNLKLPANSGELATTAYVASAIAAATGTTSSLKQAVAVATTANITLSGLQTIDGYTTVDGDRVLVKNQTTGSANGVYVAVAGSWTRALDVDTAAELSGATVFVQNGTTNGSKTFTCTTSNITLGTTSLTFTDTTTVGVVAGDGLTQTGSTIAVGSTGGGSLTVTADSVNLTSGIIATTGTYRSVTVDTYGRVTAGTNPTTFSGYGISDTSANLAAAISDETGSGALVFANSPTLVTPNIGVATGTSFNSITGLSSTTPVVNGTAAVGTATTAARADHVHPTDTSRAATAGTLAQFASTTSTQLAGVISDETGTGVLVFDTSPAFTTSVTTASTTFSVFNTNATTVNAFGAATALSVGASSGTTTINNNLTVTGNLTINGTTTTVNSTTVTIDDPIFTLGGDTAPASDDNKDRGIEFRWHNGTAAKVGFFGYDDSASVFTFIPDATNTSEVFAGTAGDVAFGKVNNVTITTPASAATLTLGSGKTVSVNNTLTFTGTDSSSVNFGAGGTVAYIGSGNAFTGANTFTNATGQTFRQAATNDGIILQGRAGGTSSYAVTLTTATLGASRTLTLPDETGTVLTSASTTSALTTVGTINSGTWNGTAIGPTYGGTGLNSYATGDLLYASAANTLSKLTKPASTTSILQMTSAGVPSWVDPCTAVANCTLDGGTF